MKTKFISILILLATSHVVNGYAPGDSLIVKRLESVTINRDTTFKFVQVDSGGVLTADSVITVTGNMIIASGGKVTHSVRNLNGLRLNIQGRLWIQRGDQPGRIEVSGSGLLGGGRSSPVGCGDRGETFASGNVICGSVGSSGGSYGGLGGTGSTPGDVASAYGVAESAVRLGSGGGAEYGPYNPGGNGGGLVRITARAVIIDGEIRADGQTIFPNCGFAYGNVGGGSGGGISIVADTVKGSAQGVIAANGGNGGCGDGGGGGGGRIVILADDQNGFWGIITALGGSNRQSRNLASSGTIFRRNSRNNNSVPGTLLFGNGGRVANALTPLRTNLNNLQNLLVREGATVAFFADSVVVSDSVLVQGNSTLQMKPSTSLTISKTTGTDLYVDGALFEVLAGATLNLDRLRLNNGIFQTAIPMAFNAAAGVQVSGANSSIRLRGSSVFSIPAFDETNFQGGTFDIGANASLKIGANSIRIGNGVTLIKDGRFGDGQQSTPDEINSLTVLAGGAVTHSTRYLSGLKLNVSGLLRVRRGDVPGRIDVSGRGLYGGGRGSPRNCGDAGETYDADGNIICGSTGSSGGSYGGIGGTGSTSGNVPSAYGVVENAGRLGSGGGAEYGPYNPGGNGGGLVRITATTVIIDGEIRSDGETIFPNCGFAYGNVGGGSGGGIFIEADTVKGSAQGVIAANGGNGSCSNGGGGGGGRIVIVANEQSKFLGAITAWGGFRNNTSNIASAGSIFRRNSRTDDGTPRNLYFGNNNRISSALTPVRTFLKWLHNVIVAQGATITFPADSLIRVDSMMVQTAAICKLFKSSKLNLERLRVNNGTFYTEMPLTFKLANNVQLLGTNGSIALRDSVVFQLPAFDETNILQGVFDIGSGASLKIDNNAIRIGNGVTLIKDGRFGNGQPSAPDQLAIITILPGGRITHSTRYLPGLALKAVNTLWVQRGEVAGKIDVSSQGLRGGGRGSCGDRGETYDADGNIICGSAGSSGGSYGGIGGTGATSGSVASAYGLLERVEHLGSGGGAEYGPYNPGGSGGGLIRITAGKLIVDGEVRADGETIFPNCGVAYNAVGGGSGGGISIEADTVMGSTQGIIAANGGNGGCNNSGGGGGGRIAILTNDQSKFLGKVMAFGGYNRQPPNIASAGTIYLKKKAGTYGHLIIDNDNRLGLFNTALKTDLAKFRDLTVRNQGSLDITKAIAVENDLSVSTGGRIGRQ